MAKASRKHIDNTLFGRFTPLCDLDPATLDKLADRATIEHVSKGNFLFERGDAAQRTFYLLEGEIELCSPLFPTQSVKANTDAGRYPLAHSFPRQFTAVTVSDVRMLMIPFDVSTIMQSDAANVKSDSTNKPAPSWESRWLATPMLRRLSAANKKALLASMAEISVQAGQVVIHQDEPADSYYVIKKGRCSVSRKPSPGARDVKLAELTAGQGFGEEALITNVPRNASVTMLNDGLLLRLDKQSFIDLLAKPLLHHLPFQHAIQLVEQGAVLVDVRTPEEFEIDGLIGSLNMPIPVLRLKASRLNRDRTYIVYSNTGQTSSVAVFLMLQQGLNACILEGGLTAAPKYRMKRGGVGDNHSEGQSGTESSRNTVLPFPNNAPPQGQSEVDWHNLSDDVLWRTTLGYRDDAGVEAALAAKPSAAAPQGGDNTLQGFDDIQLFTSVGPLQDMRLETGEEPKQGFPESDDRPNPFQQPQQRAANPAAPGAAQYRQTPQWNNRISHRPRRRLLFASLALLVLLGGWIGFFYLTNGKLPDNLEAASPLLLEQQRKLDVKVNRLLDAIESMPAMQGRVKDSNNTPPATSAPPAAPSKAPKPVAKTAPSTVRKPVIKAVPSSHSEPASAPSTAPGPATTAVPEPATATTPSTAPEPATEITPESVTVPTTVPEPVSATTPSTAPESVTASTAASETKQEDINSKNAPAADSMTQQ